MKNTRLGEIGGERRGDCQWKREMRRLSVEEREEETVNERERRGDCQWRREREEETAHRDGSD